MKINLNFELKFVVSGSCFLKEGPTEFCHSPPPHKFKLDAFRHLALAKNPLLGNFIGK